MLLYKLLQSLESAKKDALFIYFFKQNIYYSLIEVSNVEIKILLYKELMGIMLYAKDNLALKATQILKRDISWARGHLRQMGT